MSRKKWISEMARKGRVQGHCKHQSDNGIHAKHLQAVKALIKSKATCVLVNHFVLQSMLSVWGDPICL